MSPLIKEIKEKLLSISQTFFQKFCFLKIMNQNIHFLLLLELKSGVSNMVSAGLTFTTLSEFYILCMSYLMTEMLQ